MKRLRKVNTIFDGTIDLLAIGVIVLIAFVMLSICMNVVLRYIWSNPIFWVTEVATYCLLWITFLGSAWLLKREGHVRMDMVLNRLNPRHRSLLNAITSILGAIACLVVTWYGIKSVNYYFELGFVITSMLSPVKWPIMVIIPIGGFLLFIQFLRRTKSHLESWKASGSRRL